MKGPDRFKYIILSHRRRDIALPPPSEAMGMARRYFLTVSVRLCDYTAITCHSAGSDLPNTNPQKELNPNRLTKRTKLYHFKTLLYIIS